jgi:hypothetical protein
MRTGGSKYYARVNMLKGKSPVGGLKTETQRQATQHDYLPRLPGDGTNKV